ncbi:probable G-protein coupled receptor 141 [Chanos chanos]|uniref:Probable G-protein coupled receptor 141 n=1 Tax=Chanos chanos TaxID=29144 RepID=A0A6J2UVP8_CHACN|nr:probable G-protein coupled receptor 141 [Chanos chanos]
MSSSESVTCCPDLLRNTTQTNVTSATYNSSVDTTPAPGDHSLMVGQRAFLITIYTTVLVAGSMGLVLMVSVLRSNLHSVTTIAFFNLVLTHFIFLLTVPFRIYYFARQAWGLSHVFCKLVSATIHIHMYMVFFIYVFILTIRFLSFYKRSKQVKSYSKAHTLGASVALWCLVLLLILLILYFEYGKNAENKAGQCFRFGKELKQEAVFVVNCIFCVICILASCVLGGIQFHILHSILKEHGSASWSQQEFWAQVKSLCFVLIMVICFVPYHFFRLFYLRHPDRLEGVNEVFLAITSLSCLDTLTFLGRGVCRTCKR